MINLLIATITGLVKLVLIIGVIKLGAMAITGILRFTGVKWEGLK